MLLTKPAGLTIRQGRANFALDLLSCVRTREVLVLQGSPLLGAFFAAGNLTVARCLTIALLAAGSTFLTAHVFVLNDWSGMSGDLRDPNRGNFVFTCKGFGPEAIVSLSLALLVVGLLLLHGFGSTTLAIALGIAALSALYSFPGIHFKGVPIANSALHFVGGLLQFLLGYSVFVTPGWHAIKIGSFFATIFMAGHLTHETRDSDSDSLNQIKTNAVMFGKLPSFLGGLVLFAAADILLMSLALCSVVPRTLAFVVLTLPLHVYWSLKAMSSGLTFVSVQRLQSRYHLLYGAIGVWMTAALLFER